MDSFKTILVIPDLHCPFHHPDSFKFLDHLNEKYKPNKVINLGDEVDYHNISFHDSEDMPFSASKELEKAIWHLHDLYAIFPRMTICESNHGSLVYRRAKHHGLPRAFFKSYQEILEAPKNYEWVFEYVCRSGKQEIYFHHSQGKNVLKNSQHRGQCYVQGHHHGSFDIQYWANSEKLFWGVTSGCLIDKKSMAFAYGKNNLPKPILGATIIKSGYPILEPMLLNKKGRWLGKSL